MAGSRYEDPKQSGIAHLLEHVILSGSKNYPNKLELSSLVDNFGGIANGQTRKEIVSFYVRILATHIKEALEYLSEAITKPLLSEKDIEIEKNRVLEEIKWRETDTLSQQFDKIIWGSNEPMGRPIIGTTPTVKALTKKDLEDFYQRFYVPRNMVIGIAGNYDLETTALLFEKLFNSFKDRQFSLPATNSSFQGGNLQIWIERLASESTHVSLAFLTGIHNNHPDRRAMTMLMYYLFGGNTSPIHHKLLYEKGICYGVYGYTKPFSDTGICTIESRHSHANIFPFLADVILGVRELKYRFLTDEQLNIAKQKYKAWFLSQLDDNLASADETAYQELTLGKVFSPNEFSEIINAIKAKDIQRIAIEYFTKERMRLMLTNNRFGSIKLADVDEIINRAWDIKPSSA